jgi:CRP-like cAMP-binding protein
VQLESLRVQALRYLAEGDYPRALRVYEHLLACVPADLDARMRVGDVAVQVGRRDHAARVYAAVAYLDLQGGRPLHALLAMQALGDLGEDVSPLREALAKLYGAGSPRIGKVGARLAPPPPESEIEPLLFSDDDTLAAALEGAASRAADTRSVTGFPPQFQPVPLFSDLSDHAFARLVAASTVQRLGHGALLIRAGDPGDAFYLLAAGQVRVFTTDAGGRHLELARLHEGAIFGEMALISAQPRNASVEVVGSADVVAIGRTAILGAADELEAIAVALARFTRDRLIKTLLATSPLFRPFTPQQRLDLVRRFTGHEVEAGTDLIVEGDEGRGLYVVLSGEINVLRGESPFETPVARLRPGDCFGEISLIRCQPATATVRAAGHAVVLFLAREYFDRLVAAVPEMRAFFEQLTEDRLRALATEDPMPIEDADLLF